MVGLPSRHMKRSAASTVPTVHTRNTNFMRHNEKLPFHNETYPRKSRIDILLSAMTPFYKHVVITEQLILQANNHPARIFYDHPGDACFKVCRKYSAMINTVMVPLKYVCWTCGMLSSSSCLSLSVHQTKSTHAFDLVCGQQRPHLKSVAINSLFRLAACDCQNIIALSFPVPNKLNYQQQI